MKANVPKKLTRSERELEREREFAKRELEYEKREMVKRTLETCMLVEAIVYGGEGHGTKRIERHLREFIDKLHYFTDHYGEDCAVFALRKKAKELYNIEIEF